MAKEKAKWHTINYRTNKVVTKAIDDMIASRETAKKALIEALGKAGVKVPEGKRIKIAWGFDGQTPAYAIVDGPASDSQGTAVKL